MRRRRRRCRPSHTTVDRAGAAQRSARRRAPRPIAATRADGELVARIERRGVGAMVPDRIDPRQQHLALTVGPVPQPRHLPGLRGQRGVATVVRQHLAATPREAQRLRRVRCSRLRSAVAGSRASRTRGRARRRHPAADPATADRARRRPATSSGLPARDAGDCGPLTVQSSRDSRLRRNASGAPASAGVCNCTLWPTDWPPKRVGFARTGASEHVAAIEGVARAIVQQATVVTDAQAACQQRAGRRRWHRQRSIHVERHRADHGRVDHAVHAGRVRGDGDMRGARSVRRARRAAAPMRRPSRPAP